MWRRRCQRYSSVVGDGDALLCGAAAGDRHPIVPSAWAYIDRGLSSSAQLEGFLPRDPESFLLEVPGARPGGAPCIASTRAPSRRSGARLRAVDSRLLQGAEATALDSPQPGHVGRETLPPPRACSEVPGGKGSASRASSSALSCSSLCARCNARAQPEHEQRPLGIVIRQQRQRSLGSTAPPDRTR